MNIITSQILVTVYVYDIIMFSIKLLSQKIEDYLINIDEFIYLIIYINLLISLIVI